MKNRRGRPCARRRVAFNPEIEVFKPRGIPASALEYLEISHEELEALRLKNIKDLDQRECAEKMATSTSTFQRILHSANKKVARALIEGKAIRIGKIHE